MNKQNIFFVMLVVLAFGSLYGSEKKSRRYNLRKKGESARKKELASAPQEEMTAREKRNAGVKRKARLISQPLTTSAQWLKERGILSKEQQEKEAPVILCELREDAMSKLKK